MKKYLLLLVAGAFMLASCEKQEADITVTLKNSGKLKVKLAGDDGKGVADTKVKLSLYYGSGSEVSGVYDTKKTNGDGVVDFGQLIENIYYISAKDVIINGVKYNVVKPIMVTSGLDEEIKVNPQEFIGKITLKISKYTLNGYYTNGSNLNVALLESTQYNDTLTHEERLSRAAANGTTDMYGEVIFDKVPSSYYYLAYIYIDSEMNTMNQSGSLYVSKDGEEKYGITVNESDLSNTKITLNLSLYYYDSNSNTKYFNGINVIAVKYSDYNQYNLRYASLEMIRNYQVAAGKTSTTGKISMQLKASKEYIFLVYYNENQKEWSSGSVYTGSSTTNTSIQVEESNLGL